MGLPRYDQSTLPALRLSEYALSENGAAVSDHIERCFEVMRQFVQDEGWWPQVERMFHGLGISVRPGMSQDEMAFFSTSVVQQAIHQIWSRRKIVHAMNPYMVDTLSTSTADRMPGSLFAMQPYSDPLVVFARPLAVRTLYGTPGRLLGFHVVGRRLTAAFPALCSTHDETRSELLVNFNIEVDHPQGAEMISVRARVPVGQEMFTVDEVLDRTLENFCADERLLSNEADVRDALERLVRIALGVLVYICTENADVVPARPKTKTKKAKKSKRAKQHRSERLTKPTQMHMVGWVLGPALDKARRAYEKSRHQQHAATGRRQPPHQRKAHMRLFWVGRGRTQPKLKFIAPYEVSLDLLPPGVRLPRVHAAGAERRTRSR